VPGHSYGFHRPAASAGSHVKYMSWMCVACSIHQVTQAVGSRGIKDPHRARGQTRMEGAAMRASVLGAAMERKLGLVSRRTAFDVDHVLVRLCVFFVCVCVCVCVVCVCVCVSEPA